MALLKAEIASLASPISIYCMEGCTHHCISYIRNILHRGTWYALLMRANKPETAVQSSGPFSPGTTWFSIMCCAGRVWVFAGFIAAPQPIMSASESGFLLVFWFLTSRSGEGP